MKITRKARLAIYDGYGTHWTHPRTHFQESASHSDSLKTRTGQGLSVVQKVLTGLIKRGVKPGTKLTISIEVSE